MRLETALKMKIPKHIVEELIKQALSEAPDESCGYLMGNGDEVTAHYPMENVDHSPEHFSFAPEQQFAALRYARKNGLKILANWHSHPESPSRPSAEDIRLANDPTIRYAILSLADNNVVLNSFAIIHGEVLNKEEHYQASYQ